MPFRSEFACLWCGTSHRTRGPDDIEGWAKLCSDCIGKAGDNNFLRSRLRAALTERGSAARATVPVVSGAEDLDDWYRRRGRHGQGPIHDAAWDAELDAAGRWLDGLTLAGEIVELAAGTGWWSPLLAGKGELSLYDTEPASLDRARDRLLAHRLRAHIHERDPWASPDRTVDAVFCGPWLGSVPVDRRDDFLALVRGWLRPGGMFAFIVALPEGHPGTPAEWDLHDPGGLEAALDRAGFVATSLVTTGRFFLLGRATAA